MVSARKWLSNFIQGKAWVRSWDAKLPPALLVFFWGLFHWKVLFEGRTFILMDSSGFFFPLWKWGSRIWAQGIIPLWNPDAAFGTPYLADPQMAAWYPPLWFFFRFFDPVSAFNGLILGHHLWALMGFWVFARGRGFSPWVSLSGALVFGFSFNAICLTNAPALLQAFSWIPWVFWAWDGVVAGRKGSTCLLACALAMQLASGYPVFFYLTMGTLAMEGFSIFRPGTGDPKSIGVVPRTGFALFCAFLYNAVWILPLAEFLPLSNLSERMELTGNLKWDDLWSWVNPFFKGHPLHSHPGIPYSVTVYFAGLPLLVALLWGGLGRRGIGKLFAPFLALLILSLGETAWLGGWLKGIVPGYSLVVRSGYWIPFLVFWAGRLLMAAGTRLEGWDKKVTALGGRLWGTCVLVVFGGAFLSGVPWNLPSLWISMLLTAAAGSVSLSGKQRGIFLCLAILFSLGPVDRSLNFTMDRSYYESFPKTLGEMGEGGRIYLDPGKLEGLGLASGPSVAEAYQNLKKDLAPNLPLAFGWEEIPFSNTLVLRSFLRWYLWTGTGGTYPGSGKWMEYFSLRYSPRPGGELFRLGPENGAKWFSVRESLGAAEGPGFMDRISERGFDLTKTALWEGEPRPGQWFPRKLREAARGPNRVELEALGKGKALLVSSETAYPGWRSEGEGFSRNCLEVNRGFRGVLLEEGQERVSVVYRPTTFRLGFFLSLLAIGVFAGWILKLGRIVFHA